MIFNRILRREICHKTRRVPRGLLWSIPAALIILLCSCRPSQSFPTADISIATDSGSISLTVEIARTEEERQQGLMFRDQLSDGRGMIFVFERDEILSFWMKDTRIPLSIAFIASDGRILEIRDMEPFSLASVSSSRSCRYALETPKGWFERAGAAVGDKVTVASIVSAD